MSVGVWLVVLVLLVVVLMVPISSKSFRSVAFSVALLGGVVGFFKMVICLTGDRASGVEAAGSAFFSSLDLIAAA